MLKNPVEDLGSIPGLERFPGEENGCPLQYSGLEISMACIGHGISKSRTPLSDFHFLHHITSLKIFPLIYLWFLALWLMWFSFCVNPIWGLLVGYMSLTPNLVTFDSVQFSHSIMSDSLRPRGLQHARLPCPLQTPGACSNSCPSSWWWYPTISFFCNLLEPILYKAYHHFFGYLISYKQSIFSMSNLGVGGWNERAISP